MDYGRVTCCIVQTISITLKYLQSTYPNYFRPGRFSYERQQRSFHPSAVGVTRLICHQFLKWIFPNRRGHQWWSVGVIWDWFIDCIHFSLFACFLPLVFLLFTHVFLHSFIIVTWFYLTIFIFIISIPDLTLLCMCSYIFFGNVHDIKRYISQIQVIFSNIKKILYVFVNKNKNYGWLGMVLDNTIHLSNTGEGSTSIQNWGNEGKKEIPLISLRPAG